MSSVACGVVQGRKAEPVLPVADVTETRSVIGQRPRVYVCTLAGVTKSESGSLEVESGVFEAQARRWVRSWALPERRTGAESGRDAGRERGRDDERDGCGRRDRAERGSWGERGEMGTRKTERRSSANESLESNFLATKMRAKKNKLLEEDDRAGG